ncbi:hypothetical protein [Streptomyces parvulus]
MISEHAALLADLGGKQVGDGVEGEGAGLDDASVKGAGEGHPLAAVVLAEGVDDDVLVAVLADLAVSPDLAGGVLARAEAPQRDAVGGEQAGSRS